MESSNEIPYMLTNFLILFSGALVMFMAVGFCMLESGMVRSKSAAIICLKNILIYAMSCLFYYIIGYNLMFLDVGSWIGTFQPLVSLRPSELYLLSHPENQSVLAGVTNNGSMSLVMAFFQMVFVATTASIISGSLAERVRILPFMIFVGVLAAFIYPIIGAWTWGGGWLSQMGFKDFAGSTIVHSAGGWAALAGILFLGPRTGKFNKDGSSNPTPPSNIPLVALGVLILWFGWLGFNGGSVLSYARTVDALTLGTVFFNTNLAACSGVFGALVFSLIVHRRINVFMILNGAIGGLVAITAGPDIPIPFIALIIGFIGGVITSGTTILLDKFKIDDVVGAIPCHLASGIWGTLAVGIFTKASLVTQVIGIVSIGGFVAITSTLIWWILNKSMGIRVLKMHEFLGQDIVELGAEAYPEFLNIESMQKD